MSKKALYHFKKTDPKLYKAALLIGEIKPFEIRNSGDYFSDLCESIVGQQLSGKAASTIWGRFISLMPKKKVTPKNVLKVSIEDMRKAGMSYGKANYVRDLAQKVKNKEVHLDKLNQMSDKQVIDELVKVKGIGPWTAEMFLMFTLGRPDIFSHGDLGLRNGIKKIYGDLTREQIEKLCKKWSPHKSFACRILWRRLEVKE